MRSELVFYPLLLSRDGYEPGRMSWGTGSWTADQASVHDHIRH